MLSLYCLIILILQHLKVLHNYLIFITWKKMFILLIFNFNSYCNVTFNFRIMKLKHLPNVIKSMFTYASLRGTKMKSFSKISTCRVHVFTRPCRFCCILKEEINIQFVGWLILFEGAFSRYFHLNRLLRFSRDILCLLQIWMFPRLLFISLYIASVFKNLHGISSTLNWLIKRLTKDLKFHEYFFFLFD